MAVAIGFALQAAAAGAVFLATVGYAANSLGASPCPAAKGQADRWRCSSSPSSPPSWARRCPGRRNRHSGHPLVTILAGGTVRPAGPHRHRGLRCGDVVKWATVLQPFWMGILVSVVIGVALLCPFVGRHLPRHRPDRAGRRAAVAGCCANMVGFAVLSFRETAGQRAVSLDRTSMLRWATSSAIPASGCPRSSPPPSPAPWPPACSGWR